VRERAASLAAQAGITIEHIAKSHIRKEAVAAGVLKRRGEHPGLVHVISAMEACGAYQSHWQLCPRGWAMSEICWCELRARYLIGLNLSKSV
jgi:hypothetical protein